MPFASEAQRRWMWSNRPDLARRWEKEEHGAPRGVPMEFLDLRHRGLVGISDRVISDHLQLYDRYCWELAAIEDAYPRQNWAAPADLPVSSHQLQQLLETPVRSLNLKIEGQLADCLFRLKDELVARGISWFPKFYLGEDEFWTADGATAVNVPWYLANATLWRLVNDQTDRYTPEDLMLVLRHEAAHALGYAFEIWRTPIWRVTFGEMRDPYRDEFAIDPASTDFVRHLHRSGSAANLHYAQKHPDEDWAETFATWLDPGSRWREEYAEWPGARSKLEAVDAMVSDGALYSEPVNQRIGRTISYQTLDYTVGEFLGQRRPGEWSPHTALLRREPEVYDAVVLHEAYFGALRRDAGGLGINLGSLLFAKQAVAAFGSYDSWALDFRSIGGSSSGWGLCCWDPRAARVRNVLVEGHDRGVPAGCPILIAMDLHEHAYAGDYGIQKDIYLGAFFRNLDWGEVERRLVRAYPEALPKEVQEDAPRTTAPVDPDVAGKT